MPIDYKKYPANWKTEIRPAILEREGHRCKFCKVPNYWPIIRGEWNGEAVWQDIDGEMHSAATGEYLGSTYVGDVHSTNLPVKVVLTIAHLNHNIADNRPENLAALCQKCHNTHDLEYRKANRKATLNKKKGLQDLF
jgi:hypothetical protein